MINPERRPKHKHASTKQHDGGAGAQESTQRQAATGVYTPTITKEKQAARVVTKVSSRVHTPRSRPSALMTWKTLGLISLLSPAAVRSLSRRLSRRAVDRASRPRQRSRATLERAVQRAASLEVGEAVRLGFFLVLV